MQVAGSIIYGKQGNILVRQKAEAEIEMGDLLVVDSQDGSYSILQVYDLAYGSQIPEKNLEMISGMKLEGFSAELDFMDPKLRNYVLAIAKSVAHVKGKDIRIPKTLPQFMSNARRVEEKDLSFITAPENPVYLGNVRSGSKVLNVEVHLNGLDVFTHHLLIPATTGRGKSNLLKVMLWSILNKDYCGILILDPHDEYFGRHTKGLKDHPEAHDNLVYYSPRPTTGSISLVFDFKSIKPWHFRGIVEFTQAQNEAMHVAYNTYKNDWLCAIVRGQELTNVTPQTLAVLQRRIDTVLGLYLDSQGTVQCRTNVFSDTLGSRTVKDILDALETGKKVIIDTSRFTDEIELLIGSIILHEVFNNYKRLQAGRRTRPKTSNIHNRRRSPKSSRPRRTKIRRQQHIQHHSKRRPQIQSRINSHHPTNQHNPKNRPRKHEHQNNPRKRTRNRKNRHHRKRLTRPLLRRQKHRKPRQRRSHHKLKLHQIRNPNPNTPIRRIHQKNPKHV